MTTACRFQITTKNWFGKLVKSRHEIGTWQELEHLALQAAKGRPAEFDISCDTLAFDMSLILDGDRGHLAITSGEWRRRSSPVVYTLCAPGKSPKGPHAPVRLGWFTLPGWSVVEGVQ